MGSSLSARPPRGRKILAALALALALLAAGVAAQAQSLAELATYAGPDRTQKLIDGAKKENALNIYSSMTTADMGALIAAFAAKYGIKAQHWRGSSEDTRNRTTANTPPAAMRPTSPKPPAPIWRRWSVN